MIVSDYRLATYCDYAKYIFGMLVTGSLIFITIEIYVGGNPSPYVWLALISTAIFAFAKLIKSRLETKKIFEQTTRPGGEQLPSVTLNGFDKELEEVANEKKKIAEIHFQAGKKSENKHAYTEAEENYRQSADILPAMSSFLNLGNSLLNISSLEPALAAYRSGLKIAEEKNASEYKGTFLGNIGIVYYNQGKFKQALESYDQSIEIIRRIGYFQSEANQLGNIGNVYFNQGKFEQALESYIQSYEISRKIGYPHGEANQLGNIGAVYLKQRKFQQALKFENQSLEIQRKIGNSLSEAKTLGNIGLVYFNQGKFKQALEHLKQARKIFNDFGAEGGELIIVDESIKKIEQLLEDDE